MSTEVGLHAAEQQKTSVTVANDKAPVQFLDLKAQFAGIRHEVMAAIERVMESQHFILGDEVQSFERELAGMVGAQFAVGCASGSDALLLALLALGVTAGDEVITTPFTFVATAGAIARVGARAVFVDIQPDTFNIAPHQLRAAITSKTRAIIPVHLFGLAADLDPILEIANQHQLGVIEDAAQAIGARYRQRHVGSVGTLGCFSFFPSKNLGGAGDGGMITTSDSRLADTLRLLRVHGSRKKYQYEILGLNSRLDSLQAAILRVKLRHLDAWTRARANHASLYETLFAEYNLTGLVTVPSVPADRNHVYNQFSIRCRERDRLQGFLRGRGIATDVYYPTPLHVQPAFAFLGYRAGQFPQAEAASREVLALPIYPELTEQQQSHIVSAIAAFYSA